MEAWEYSSPEVPGVEWYLPPPPWVLERAARRAEEEAREEPKEAMDMPGFSKMVRITRAGHNRDINQIRDHFLKLVNKGDQECNNYRRFMKGGEQDYQRIMRRDEQGEGKFQRVMMI